MTGQGTLRYEVQGSTCDEKADEVCTVGEGKKLLDNP